MAIISGDMILKSWFKDPSGEVAGNGDTGSGL
jgi:hypothetical protein